jgi:putative transposase
MKASAELALVRPIFERLFDKFGLPKAIQSDNGLPFASTRALGGLTPLSAWWVSLGIRVVRFREQDVSHLE